MVRQVFTSYLSWVFLVGNVIHAYWAAPLLRQFGRGKRLSAAQRCNEDVLHEIFAELPPSTLSSAARVCRGWTSPARHALYHDLRVDNLLLRSPEKLADTLFNNSWIRTLVRRPTLYHSANARRSPNLLDWIELLPEHSFLSVKISKMESSQEKPLPTLDALLDFPAIRTAPHLTIYCSTFLTPERFDKVLRLPCLEHLAINIPAKTTINLKDITAFPNLRRLSIMADIYPPLVAKLVHGLPSPLERFDLLADNVKPADLDTLRRVLYRHAPHLRHLALFGEPITQLPSSFMNDFVLYCPVLETIVCPDKLYTPRIISRLPPTLRSLALCTPDTEDPPFPINKYAAALRKHRSEIPELQTLTIVNCQGRPPNYSALKEVCKTENIVFQHTSNMGVDILGEILFNTA